MKGYSKKVSLFLILVLSMTMPLRAFVDNLGFELNYESGAYYIL